jgi:hypothetical protein
MISKDKQYRYRDYPKETVTILDIECPGDKPVISRSSLGASFHHDAEGRYVTRGPQSGRRDLIEVRSLLERWYIVDVESGAVYRSVDTPEAAEGLASYMHSPTRIVHMREVQE